jgi:hypothetical protein
MLLTPLDVGGNFELTCRSRSGVQKWRAVFANGVTVQGCNNVLDVNFRGVSQSTFFVGVISQAGYSGVSPSDTHGSHSGWNEWPNYAGNRPAWAPGPATGGIMPTLGTFSWVMNAAGFIRGAFLASTNVVGSLNPSALLYCTAVMGSGLAVASSDVIHGTYVLTIRE